MQNPTNRKKAFFSAGVVIYAVSFVLFAGACREPGCGPFSLGLRDGPNAVLTRIYHQRELSPDFYRVNSGFFEEKAALHPRFKVKIPQKTDCS